MSKVEIFKDKGMWHVEVDGVNLSGAITDGGVRVEFEPGGMPPVVHLTLRPRELNMTLPVATVEAVEALLPEREL